jgi:hypothetical protein
MFWVYIRTVIFISFLAFLFISESTVRAEPVDSDNDGLTDDEEIRIYQTDPYNPDTDGDGIPDGVEIKNGYSPLTALRKKLTDLDTDHDGLSDALEIALGTDLSVADTDIDGIKDGDEVFGGSNPLVGEGNRDVKRHAEVDLTTQQLSYYMNDVKIGSMPVSSGKLQTPTPLGEFSVLRKVPIVHYIGPGYNLPNTKWNLEFKRSYYLHGAYWHNQFGIRPMSHGCVNISYKDVVKLYSFLDVGDKVYIKGKTPTGIVKLSAVETP